MTTQAALSIAFVVFLYGSPAYAQVSDMIGRRDTLILRAPGSQIGVSARDRISLETGATSLNVIIEQVRANTPASRAGLIKGDVVTVFDGQRVLNANLFSRLVEETPPGWTVKMTIIRNGKVRELSITPEL
jgi:S1-C subfamily serine protease